MATIGTILPTLRDVIRRLDPDGKIAKITPEGLIEYEELQNSKFYNEVLVTRHKIYDNGGCQTYR